MHASFQANLTTATSPSVGVHHYPKTADCGEFYEVTFRAFDGAVGVSHTVLLSPAHLRDLQTAVASAVANTPVTEPDRPGAQTSVADDPDHCDDKADLPF